MKTNLTHRKKIIFTLILFLIVFLLFEIASHLTLKKIEMPTQPRWWTNTSNQSLMEYHPVLGWFHKKNETKAGKINGRDVVIHTNSLGLRGTQEYDLTSNKTRWYIFGDSFVFGFGVEDKEAFPAQITALDPEQETFNLGVAAYGMDQIYLLSQEFSWDYAPEITLICIFPRDFWRATQTFNSAGMAKPYFMINLQGELVLRNVPVPPYPKNFAPSRFPDLREKKGIQKVLSYSAILKAIKRILLEIKVTHQDTDTLEWDLGKPILSKMIKEIRQKGSTPYLVIVPPRQWITDASDASIAQNLKRFASGEQIEIIDFTPILREKLKGRSMDDLYIPFDKHWTAEAHRIVAETLLQEIIYKKRVPS